MMSWAGFDGIVRDGGPDCWSKRVCWTTPRAGGHLDRSGDEAGVVSGAKQDGAPLSPSGGEGDLGYTLLRAMRARAGSVLRHRQPRDAAARVSVRPRASEAYRGSGQALGQGAAVSHRMKQPQRSKGIQFQTETDTTETEAKKAAARAYRPAIVRLANGRYAYLQTGYPLPQGARAVSRWGTNRWRAFE